MLILLLGYESDLLMTDDFLSKKERNEGKPKAGFCGLGSSR